MSSFALAFQSRSCSPKMRSLSMVVISGPISKYLIPVSFAKGPQVTPVRLRKIRDQDGHLLISSPRGVPRHTQHVFHQPVNQPSRKRTVSWKVAIWA
jgi:hypothetical protein